MSFPAKKLMSERVPSKFSQLVERMRNNSSLYRLPKFNVIIIKAFQISSISADAILAFKLIQAWILKCL